MSNPMPGRVLFRLVALLMFVGVSVVGFSWFWTQTGGSIPGISADRYQVVFQSADVNNLLEFGDVKMAGVQVGRVASVSTVRGYARVVINLKDSVAPLHKGATVRVGVKSIIGQSYVNIEDGHGAPIPNQSRLPNSAVLPPVQIHDVIAALKPQTREALSGAIQSLGAGTKGRMQDIDRLAEGLGKLGRGGYTALDAIAAQTEDLKALTREATKLLDALDTGRGQIAIVVRDVQRLAEATAGQREAIKASIRALPEVLFSARTASGDLTSLAESLAPVARDLKQAAPNLDHALLQLPAITNDVRGLLPALNGTLDKAPATLERVPTLGEDVRDLVPEARAILRDANPMLAYLAPYGRDVGAMLASFGSSIHAEVENGVNPILLAPIFDSGSFRNVPVELTQDPTIWANPYPEPGKAGDPKPFRGEYPRVERAPR